MSPRHCSIMAQVGKTNTWLGSCSLCILLNHSLPNYFWKPDNWEENDRFYLLSNSLREERVDLLQPYYLFMSEAKHINKDQALRLAE